MDLITIPIITLVGIIGLALAGDWGAIVFGEFVVVEDLKKEGIHSEVVVQRLVDDLRQIRAGAGSNIRLVNIDDDQRDLALTALGDYLKIGALINASRQYLGLIRYHISGEIVRLPTEDGAKGKRLEMRVRLLSQKGRVFSMIRQGPETQLNQLIRESAEQVMRVIDPYVLSLYYRGEETRSGSKDFPRTYEMIRHMLKTLPNNEQYLVYNLWGRTLYLQEDYAGSIEKFEMSIRLEPKFALPYVNLGMSLAKMGRHAEAVTWHRKGLAADPTLASGYTELAAAQMALGRHGDALATLQQAVAANPQSAALHSQLGRMLMDAGDRRAALAAFSKAVELAPGNQDYAEQEKAARRRPVALGP